MNTKIIAGLALLGLGLAVMSGSKSPVEKVFYYQNVEVTMTKGDDGWSWKAERRLWFGEYEGWPKFSSTTFPTSEAAALDAMRVIGETVPFK